jgi:hypothetical protein
VCSMSKSSPVVVESKLINLTYSTATLPLVAGIIQLSPNMSASTRLSNRIISHANKALVVCIAYKAVIEALM